MEEKFNMKKILTIILIILFAASLSFAIDELFTGIDKNKDGKISKQEYLDAAKKTFNKLDKNRDGFLSKEELEAADKAAAKKFLKETDVNKDGKISQEEYIKAAEKRFKFLDKNHDGFIDQKEWNDKNTSVNRNSQVGPVSPLIMFTF